MDRAKFFAAVRSPLSISKKAQVQGIDATLDEAERRGTPLPHLAAILAEAHHETGGAMQPVSENLNHSAKRLTEVWPSRFPTIAAAQPFANNPRKLANKVYGGRLGNTGDDDCWLYRGRGLADPLGQSRCLGGRPAGGIKHLHIDRLVAPSGKQPVPRAGQSPIGVQEARSPAA
jgi:putative chitinase